MPSLKQINKRIVSLKNMRKITRAMKMIAATKLRRAQDSLAQSKLYQQVLNEFIARLSAGSLGFENKLFQPHEVVKGITLVVITSDRGLCGSFNNSIIKKAHIFCEEQEKKGVRVELCFFGKRGYEAFRKGNRTIKEYTEGAMNSPTFTHADRVGQFLIEQFLRLDIDEVYLLHNEFKSTISQIPVLKKLLPFTPETCEGVIKKSLFILEPEPEEIINDLALRAVKAIVYRGILTSVAAEHAARMTAMDSATNNCSELLDKTTLKRNKARQAAITTELVEIVSGAESSK